MNNIPPGYKQTEVGVIPEDWVIFSVQALIDNGSIVGHLDGNHGALYPRSEEFKHFGVPYITANDFGNHTVSFQNCKFLSVDRAKCFRKGISINGDVLFAHNATVGPVALLETDLDYVILSTTATYFRCNKEKLSNYFMVYLLQSSSFVHQYSAVMSQSTRNQVPITAQRKLNVILPPTLAEQTAIAEALSDADAIIESLEQLIAKKRHLKQGAMQELLTGKKRLEGFKGEWVVKRLGEIGESLIGLTYKPSEVKFDGVLVLRSSNVFEGRIRLEDNVFVETEIPERIMVRVGDILICVRNGSRDLIGKCAKIDEQCQGMTFGAFMAVFRTPFHNFVHHQFQSNVIKRQIHEHLGATINQITNKSLNSFQVPFPLDESEQTAIAAILSDMDAEIAALETKLAKNRAIKQGMMNKLLTGKVRLI